MFNMRKLLGKLFRSAGYCAKPQGTRLRVEALEERWWPAGSWEWINMYWFSENRNFAFERVATV